MNKNRLSGWLSPQGQFISVPYGKHDEVARILEERNIVHPIYDINDHYTLAHGERLLELLGYIKFVSRSLDTMNTESYVFFPSQFGYRGDITDSQIIWIEENYKNMTSFQRKYCKDYLY